MPFRRKLTAGMAVFLLAARLVSPLAAQQKSSWEELNGKVESLQRQGKYAEAVSVAQEALRVGEASFGREHPNLARSLNNLALLYYTQGKYAEVEPLYKRSLTTREKALGPDHADVAVSLNNLAELYRAQGKYAEAEPLSKRSLAIVEKALGPDHPTVATSLSNLALLYYTQGKYAEAEPLSKRSLTIVEKARTPEQVVGNLAYKTPDLQSRPNVHHSRLLAAELSGAGTIVMDGRPVISGGKPVTLKGKTDIVFQRTPEEDALDRWHKGEFLDLERLTAKAWSRALSNVDYEGEYKFFQKWFEGGEKPKTLSDVKSLADANIDRTNQESWFEFGLSLLGVPLAGQQQAIAADLISRVRPSNKVDLAYLYYLPFCMVFTSSDNLHARTAPLFLREDQTFVRGAELKTDLGKLDQFYSCLPENVRSRGVFHFADCPPTDSSFLVTQMWDKYLPIWRKHKAEPRKPADEATQKALLDLINRVQDAALSSDPTTQVSTDDAAYVQIQRKVLPRKGKWQRFPREVTNERDRDSGGY